MTEQAEQKLTGYPSIDKPWLKYYSEEAINSALPECTIYEYLWQNNKDHLDDIALNYFDRKITYGELFENIDKAACAFSAIGVKPGDIVTVCAVTIPETIYSFYGLNRLGAVSNMTDPRTSIDGLKDYIIEVHSDVVICIDVVYPKIAKAIEGTGVKTVLIISPADSLPQPKKAIYKVFNSTKIKMNDIAVKWDEFIDNGKEEIPNYPTYKKDVCCVIEHTGGTTGSPKGVMLSSDNINALACQYFYGLDTSRQQKFLNIMPPFIAYGVAIGIHMPMCCGNTIILIPQFNPEKFDKLIVKYKPNHFCGVPTHFDTLLSSKRMDNFDLSFLVSAGMGGDKMDIDSEQKINDFLASHNNKYKVAKGYGMTETSSCSCSCLCKNNESNKLGSTGVPLIHNLISVFDASTGKELKYNEIGEICISSPTMMLGYFDNENETNKIIKRHEDGRLWVHSGDIGYMDNDGCLFIADRAKRMIIRHDGFKVFPSLIENAVSSHAAVKNCCAVGVADKQHSQGKLPVAVAVLKDNSCTNRVKKELMQMCRDKLPEYVQPADFMFVSELPLTPIGKVDYRALEKQAGEVRL